MARLNKWRAKSRAPTLEAREWAESTLRAAGLPTGPACYIAVCQGGSRPIPDGAASSLLDEPIWFAILTVVVEQAGHLRGSREHLAATLMVVLAFYSSAIRAGETRDAEEGAFRAGMLWEAAQRDDDAALGRKNLKVQTGPHAATLENLARVIARIASLEPYDVQGWAEATLRAAGLPT
jgi:hypothetical protein